MAKKLSQEQIDPMFEQLKSALSSKVKENATGKKLLILLSGEINNSPIHGSGNTTIELKTPAHLMVAQLFISLLDSIDSTPGDGVANIGEDFTTPKLSVWFIKLTLKGNLELTISIEDV